MMRKLLPAPSEAAPLPRRRWPFLRLALAGLVIAPYLYEFGRIWFSRWMSLVGRSSSAPTPVIDATVATARSIWVNAGSYFNNVPWRADLVVLSGLAWFAGCSFLMRKR